MTRGSIGFGIIGAGVAAETHARELAHVNGARLEAIFARDPEKAERFRAAFSIQRSYSEVDHLLADPTVEVVIVATPNGLHRDFALAAAAAGKHVVVEKPLEIDSNRAGDIISACELARRHLFVIYQRRYSEAARQAKSDIDLGKLGSVVLVNIIDHAFRRPDYYQKDYWRGSKRFEGGGCVITQSTHLIDLAQHLVGPISSVFAHTSTRFHAIETEDAAVAVFRFANGAMGTLSSSTAACPGLRHLVTISGTEGSLIINGEHDQVAFRFSKHDDDLIDAGSGFQFSDSVDPRSFPTRGQRAQLQLIVNTLLADDAQPTFDRVELLGALRVSDAIYRSAQEAREIRIRY